MTGTGPGTARIDTSRPHPARVYTDWHPELADGESTDDSAVISLYGAVGRKP
ncbi:SAM-dependent methyltransferase [Streptomyces sp. NPDC006967]|uniref:SAM-dependent methyltransferase n=1 Tax=unclassified Streptomyces TaxID=2593676 RepID=UPI0021560B03|nr:SAM-dependent methyltransferase [Streptomyces sp. SM1]